MENPEWLVLTTRPLTKVEMYSQSHCCVRRSREKGTDLPSIEILASPFSKKRFPLDSIGTLRERCFR